MTPSTRLGSAPYQSSSEESPPDYPAAHSMDSCWFGVDRDGRVGFFETGEAGAMPTHGLRAGDAERARVRIGQLVPAGESVVDLRGRLLPYVQGGGLRHLLGGEEFPILMFLDSLDPVREALSDGRAVPVQAREGLAVMWHGLPDTEYDRLHRDDPELCKGCFWRFEVLEEPFGEGSQPRVNPAWHGVYLFKALGGNATANPYGLHEAPVHPVHLDQLPPGLRERVKEVRFPAVSFAETAVFQPAELVPCIAYEGIYVDMAGRPHPLPTPHQDVSADEYLRRLAEMTGTEDHD